MPAIQAKLLVLPGEDAGESRLMAADWRTGWVVVWEVSATDVRVHWSFGPVGEIIAAPVAVSGAPGSDMAAPMVLLADSNGVLRLLEPPAEIGGAPRVAWRFSARAAISGKPAVYQADDQHWVAFADHGGWVYRVPILLR